MDKKTLAEEWEARLASYVERSTEATCEWCLKEFTITRDAGRPPKTCSQECARARKTYRESRNRIGRTKRVAKQSFNYSNCVNEFENDPLFREPFGTADALCIGDSWMYIHNRAARRLVKTGATKSPKSCPTQDIDWDGSHQMKSGALHGNPDEGETVLDVVPWSDLHPHQQEAERVKVAKTVANRLKGNDVGLINRHTDYVSENEKQVDNFYSCFVSNAHGNGWCRWCSQREKDWKESFKALTAEFDRCPAHYATVLPPFFIGGFDEQQNGFQNLRPEYQVSAV